jgi:hypothetical protein
LQYILKRSNSGITLPDDIDANMRKLRQMIFARNIFLFEELKKVLGAFNEADIEAIVLKGVMMEGIYPPGLRPFTDMDILIHREKLSQVIEILCGLGYRPYAPQLRPGAEDFQGAVNYVRAEAFTIMIEPHWTLGPPYPYSGRIEIEGLWQRAKKANIAGINTLVLSPEDSLLHSCLHLFQHCQNGWLASSCDIAELIHHYEDRLDWALFLSGVFEFKIYLPVQYSLEKTFALFKPPIPSFVLEQLHAYKPSRFERWVFASLTSPRDKDGGGTAILARLLTMPGATLRLRYLWAHLFPGRKFMIKRYPALHPKLMAFYYLYRLRDIFWKGVKTLLCLLLHRA